MYFWNSYPFIRLSIVLILGIWGFDLFSKYWQYPTLSIGILTILLCLLIFYSHRTSFYKFRHLNGVLSFLTIFLLGGYVTKLQYFSHSPNHYKYIRSEVKGFSGTIISTGNELKNHYRYVFQLEKISCDTSFQTSGIIHLYVRKDSVELNLRYGDRLLVKKDIYLIPDPINPGVFNYKEYLARQNIYAHAFVTNRDIKYVNNSPPSSILELAYSIREKASKTIDLNIIATRENAIAKALLLGIKDHLDNDIKKTYSSAGVMHVLAVSGLHVGIIYLLLQFLFGKLREQGNVSKKIFGLVCIVVIWLYAIITGLSPSVMRSATMFSLIAISQATARGGNIYNTLGFSAFLLLLYDPHLIYSVGFQLSYTAVIGIVYLQPKLYPLLDFRSWVFDKVWAIICISIAAQLATFPLSVYYFHQFPTYFLVANIIIIPAAFIMLVGGITMLLVAPLIHVLGTVIGYVLYHFMWGINEIISMIEILPNSRIEWIYMDWGSLIFTYAIMVTIAAGLHYGSFKTLLISFFLGLSLIGGVLKSNHNQSKKEQLIFYELKEGTAIDHIRGHNTKLYTEDDNPEELELLAFQINPHRLASRLRPIHESVIKLSECFATKESLSFGEIAGFKIIIFDSTTFHLDFRQPIQADIILINNQSVKNMKWLKEHFHTDLIIIGNNNSRYYSIKIKKQAEENGLHVHSLREDGALIMDLTDHNGR